MFLVFLTMFLYIFPHGACSQSCYCLTVSVLSWIWWQQPLSSCLASDAARLLHLLEFLLQINHVRPEAEISTSYTARTLCFSCTHHHQEFIQVQEVSLFFCSWFSDLFDQSAQCSSWRGGDSVAHLDRGPNIMQIQHTSVHYYNITMKSHNCSEKTVLSGVKV